MMYIKISTLKYTITHKFLIGKINHCNKINGKSCRHKTQYARTTPSVLILLTEIPRIITTIRRNAINSMVLV